MRQPLRQIEEELNRLFLAGEPPRKGDPAPWIERDLSSDAFGYMPGAWNRWVRITAREEEGEIHIVLLDSPGNELAHATFRGCTPAAIAQFIQVLTRY